jgi:hypothetical protein
MKEKIRDNAEKIKQNKVLPYLVGNIVEVRNLCVSKIIVSAYILTDFRRRSRG